MLGCRDPRIEGAGKALGKSWCCCARLHGLAVSDTIPMATNQPAADHHGLECSGGSGDVTAIACAPGDSGQYVYAVRRRRGTPTDVGNCTLRSPTRARPSVNRVTFHFAAVMLLSWALVLGAGTAFAQSGGSSSGGGSSGGGSSGGSSSAGASRGGGSAASAGRTGAGSIAPRAGGTGSGVGTNDPRSSGNQPATSTSPGSIAPGTYAPGSHRDLRARRRLPVPAIHPGTA